jgi:hypothetical protein
VRPFLERHSLVLAGCLVGIAVLRIASTWPLFGAVGDEPAHLAAGMEYLSKRVYNYDRQHAPLACVMAALGPYLAGARSQGYPGFMQEGLAIVNSQGHPELTLDLVRLGVLPFFLLGCFVVYRWAARDFGKAVAVIATGLFTLVPPVLAHAGVGCTDMALAACLGAAFLVLIEWAEDPSWGRTVLLGAAVAAAILSRFTAIGYLGGAAVLSAAGLLLSRRGQIGGLVSRAHAVRFPVAALVTAFLVWAGYRFSFGKFPGWSVPLPAPEFFDGLGIGLEHARLGHPAYLLGEYSLKGWWYYFPLALAVKTPLGFLILALAGTWLCVRRWREPRYWLPIAFAVGILVPAIASHVNIGLRLILPVYIAFSIAGALAVDRWAASKWGRAVAGVLVLWVAVSGVAAHPNYIPYFNELAGSEPDRILVDSDYDWGQDTKRLAKRLHELGATSASFFGVGASDKDYELLRVFPGLPALRPIHPINPTEGYTAVSPTFWRTTQYGLYYKYPNIKPWWERLQPQEKVGTLLLYYVPPGSLRRTQ